MDKDKVTMKKTTFTIFLISACVALWLTTQAQSNDIYAQRLVDRIAASHPELNVLGLHVTPPNSSDNIIIACSNRSKVGKKSDPDDLDVMKTLKPVIEVKNDRKIIDGGLPLYDASRSSGSDFFPTLLLLLQAIMMLSELFGGVT